MKQDFNVKTGWYADRLWDEREDPDEPTPNYGCPIRDANTEHHEIVAITLGTTDFRKAKYRALVMAAAPDLLDALEELCAWQNGCPLPTYEKGWTKAMDMARAAIAKAKGESAQ